MVTARLTVALVWFTLLALAGCGGGDPSDPAGAGRGLAEPTMVPQSEPVALRIPAIGVDSKRGEPWLPLGIQGQKQGERVVPVETKAGEIETPPVSEPLKLGWYCPDGLENGCGAPTPGELGPAVVLGHINGRGQAGIFAKLDQLKAEDEIHVDRADGYTATFKVRKVEIVDKTKFPTQAVYGDTSVPALRLVSCGGRLDRANHRYLDQVIVYADLIQFQPTDV